MEETNTNVVQKSNANFNEDSVAYATLFRRAAAANLDFGILILLALFIYFATSEISVLDTMGIYFKIGAFIITCLIYFIFFWSSKYQATPGMMAVSCKVVDDRDYSRISKKQALLRFFLSTLFYVSPLIIIGIFYFISSRKRQYLEDKLTKTCVISVSQTPQVEDFDSTYVTIKKRLGATLIDFSLKCFYFFASLFFIALFYLKDIPINEFINSNFESELIWGPVFQLADFLTHIFTNIYYNIIFLLFLSSLSLLPLLSRFKGTIGMQMMGYKIVKKDGSDIDFMSACIRALLPFMFPFVFLALTEYYPVLKNYLPFIILIYIVVISIHTAITNKTGNLFDRLAGTKIQPLKDLYTQPVDNEQFATAIGRGIAFLIDYALFVGVIFGLRFCAKSFLAKYTITDTTILFGSLLVYLFYVTFTQSSKLQATIGQKIMGYKIVKQDLSPIKWYIAALRFFPVLIVIFAVLILTGLFVEKDYIKIIYFAVILREISSMGYAPFFIYFSKRKQTLSDMLFKTCVIKVK